MSRRLARESAIKFLFSIDFNKEEDLEEMLGEFFDAPDEQIDDEYQDMLSENDIKYAEEVIKGTIDNMQHIDKLIQGNITGWTKDRIIKVDLAVLRLALYEILYRDDIPDSVAINEAIELAKKYSTEESGSFVNGVLGKIVRESGPKGE